MEIIDTNKEAEIYMGDGLRGMLEGKVFTGTIVPKAKEVILD